MLLFFFFLFYLSAYGGNIMEFFVEEEGHTQKTLFFLSLINSLVICLNFISKYYLNFIFCVYLQNNNDKQQIFC